MKQLKENFHLFIRKKKTAIISYIFLFLVLSALITFCFPIMEKWIMNHFPINLLETEYAIVGNCLLMIAYLVFLVKRKIQKIEVKNSHLLKVIPIVFVLFILFTTKPEYKALPLYGWYKYYYSFIFIFFAELSIYINSFKRIKKKENESFLQEDVPWKDGDKDLLSYTTRSQKLATEIKRFHSTEGPLSIGINGEWGSGKSSFINMVRKELKNNKQILHSTYSPWINPNKISTDFFNLLTEILSPHSSLLKNAISRYSRALTTIDNSGITNFAIHVFKKEKSYATHLKEINSLIDKLDKKIVIFIDDLDRLDFEEIMQVFKLIRNTATLNNTIFICAYDKKYILKTLENKGIYDADKFIEKIFQFEIALTAPHLNLGPDYLFNELKKRFPDKPEILRFKTNEHKTVASDEINTHDYYALPDIVEDYLSSIRNCKRAYNNISFAFSNAYSGLKFDFLLLLELIKLMNYDLYKTIDLSAKKRSIYPQNTKDIRRNFVDEIMGNAELSGIYPRKKMRALKKNQMNITAHYKPRRR